MKKMFLMGILVFLTCRFASAQVAPAGITFVQSGTRYYLFGASGTYDHGASFIFLDFSTGLLDAITPNVSANGSFSGTSSATGRTLSGQIGATSVSFSYNGATLSGSKLSSYGLMRKFAGEWVGFISDNSFGIGFAEAQITSQGQMFVIAAQASLDAGVGTINAAGQFSVQLLSGRSISGTFSPSHGIATGSYAVSTGAIEGFTLIRAIPSRLENISTRGVVGTGEQVLIGGFIVGDGGKTVLIDAKGPSLAAAGVSDPVTATKLDLYHGSTLIASNNGWRNNSNSDEIQASGVAPTDDLESALQVTLEPGSYTVVVSSANSSTGIGLVEIYGVGNTGGP